MNCLECKTPLKPGKALAQTFTSGAPDFSGDDSAVTFSAGGPGRMIDCMKCPECGWSVTIHEGNYTVLGHRAGEHAVGTMVTAYGELWRRMVAKMPVRETGKPFVPSVGRQK